MKGVVDFNADLGEGMGEDAALVAQLSSASIACGFHAGDPDTMRRSVALCLQQRVAIGAHPSLPDREGFGRRALAVTPEDAYSLTLYQTGALAAFAQAAGTKLHHVKPHGALYNLAASDVMLAGAIARAVHDFDPGLVLYGLANSALTAAGEAIGLSVAHEAFAERRYEADGSLTPRSAEGAVIEEVEQAALQVAQMLMHGHVTARTGERVPIRADTICLHGDRSDAPAFAQALRRAIEQAGFVVQTMERRA